MFCSQIPSEVYLSSHLQGKKHKEVILANAGGKDLSKQDIVSGLLIKPNLVLSSWLIHHVLAEA